MSGYMYTECFPESGGGYYQWSGDLTTSFDRTASIWYDRCSNSIRSAMSGSMTTLATAYNASRTISYLVIRTWRYADVPLLDMRVHDIDVAVNVRATLPWVPEPPKGEEPISSTYDGTSTGTGAAVSQGSLNGRLKTPKAEDLIGIVQQWWIGPWPRLHTKVDHTSSDGCSVKYHVSIDLLGYRIVEENMEIRTNSPADPVNQPGFASIVGGVFIKAYEDNHDLELTLVLTEIATMIACAVLEKVPWLWPAAAALGAIWTLGFAIYLGVVIADVCGQTRDPFTRFWAIFLLGGTVLYGPSMAEMIGGLAVYLWQRLGGFTEFVLSRTTASLTFFFWTFICTLIVLIMAGIVLALTLVGLC